MRDGDRYLTLAVTAVRVVAANVEIYAAGACDRSDDCEILRCFVAEYPRRFKAVLDGGRFQDQTRDIRKITMGSRDSLAEFSHLAGVEVKSQAARDRDSPPVPRSTTLR
jgi:hypothetical protein